MAVDKIVVVKPEHIEPGILKYKGVIDESLKELIVKAKYTYVPYLFEDGRVLLVMPHNISALLYPSKKVLFEKLDLTPKAID